MKSGVTVIILLVVFMAQLPTSSPQQFGVNKYNQASCPWGKFKKCFK